MPEGGKYTPADGEPVDMSELTLGPRYGAEDMYRDMGIERPVPEGLVYAGHHDHDWRGRVKILAAFTAVFVVLSVLGFTVYFHDLNPWGGWFVPLWFVSLGGAVLVLSVVGITRALGEIASGAVDGRRHERAAARRLRETVDVP